MACGGLMVTVIPTSLHSATAAEKPHLFGWKTYCLKLTTMSTMTARHFCACESPKLMIHSHCCIIIFSNPKLSIGFCLSLILETPSVQGQSWEKRTCWVHKCGLICIFFFRMFFVILFPRINVASSFTPQNNQHFCQRSYY